MQDSVDETQEEPAEDPDGSNDYDDGPGEEGEEEQTVEDYVEGASIPVIIKILTEHFIPLVSDFAVNQAKEVLQWNDKDSDSSSSSDDSDDDDEVVC